MNAADNYIEITVESDGAEEIEESKHENTTEGDNEDEFSCEPTQVLFKKA